MSKDRFSVRPFTPGIDNADDIAELHLKIRKWEQAAGQADFSGRLRSSQDDLKGLQRFYIEPGGNFFLAKDSEGKIIGFVGLKNNGGGEGAFKRLAVLPQWQRKGVGTALVAAAMDWARKAGFTKLGLQTHNKEHARPLYEKFGFKVSGWADERQDWLMELTL